jgi:aryl-alcohol dehydrogenase-like predicted oxidoreductase
MTLVNSGPRSIGSHSVGPLAYGMWRYTSTDVAVNQALLETALDAGMNLIDTADVYGIQPDGSAFGSVEERLGAVLAVAPQLRDRMVLATKGGIRPPVPYDSSAGALRAACEDSLRRLGVDHIDLYQIHRPDLFAHPAEVAATLAALRDEGKIGAIGVSNHTVAQTEALRAHLGDDAFIATTQPEYSAACLGPLRDGTFDLCMRQGITALAWSPLAGGRLMTGDGIRPELLTVLDGLAEREGTTRDVVALAFVLAAPCAPLAIIGTQRPERVVAATAALGVTLDRSDVYAIVAASEGVPLP